MHNFCSFALWSADHFPLTFFFSFSFFLLRDWQVEADYFSCFLDCIPFFFLVIFPIIGYFFALFSSNIYELVKVKR